MARTEQPTQSTEILQVTFESPASLKWLQETIKINIQKIEANPSAYDSDVYANIKSVQKALNSASRVSSSSEGFSSEKSPQDYYDDFFKSKVYSSKYQYVEPYTTHQTPKFTETFISENFPMTPVTSNNTISYNTGSTNSYNTGSTKTISNLNYTINSSSATADTFSSSMKIGSPLILNTKSGAIKYTSVPVDITVAQVFDGIKTWITEQSKNFSGKAPCASHPKYLGIRRPTTVCAECWRVHTVNAGQMKALNNLAKLRSTLSSVEDKSVVHQLAVNNTIYFAPNLLNTLKHYKLQPEPVLAQKAKKK